MKKNVNALLAFAIITMFWATQIFPANNQTVPSNEVVKPKAASKVKPKPKQSKTAKNKTAKKKAGKKKDVAARKSAKKMQTINPDESSSTVETKVTVQL